MAGYPASGVRSAEWYRAANSDVSASGIVLAAGAGKAAVIAAPADANHTIFVQKLTLSFTTVAAQTVTVRDNAGTPINIAVAPASQAGQFIVDFGARGFALTAGKQLDIAGTAGPAYAYAIDAYVAQTSTVAASTVDRTF